MGQVVVLYGVGSPIVVDFEETLARAGWTLAAGVHNVAGPCYLLDQRVVICPAAVTDALRQVPFLVPLFTPGHRQQAAAAAVSQSLVASSALVDPTVSVPRSSRIGLGTFVNVGCTLGGACQLGDFVLVNRGASIGHHDRLADFASIGPGAVLAGNVRVGKGSVVGAGAVVLPEVTIGSNAVVGAGAVVTKDVPDHAVVAGNPAAIIRRASAGYHGQAVT